MAFNVSALANYTDEQRADLLSRSLFANKTAELLYNAGQVQVGVKSASALNILTSTVFFQADGCGLTPSGSTTFTQRNITVGAIKVEETLCPKSLESKWMQTQIAPGSAIEVPFEEQIGREKAERIARLLEIAMWQGDTASTNTNPNTNRFDGFVKLIDAASASTIAGNTISATAITTSNIDDILDAMYAVVPSEIASESDLVCFIGIDNYKKYLLNLKNANLYHYMQDASEAMESIIPGTNVRLVAVGGLDGTNRLFLGRLNNFFVGTDLLDEEENYKFVFDPISENVYFKASMKYGVQVAFPDQLVQFKLA